MHLYKSQTRKVGTERYYKWIVNVPAAVVKELGWDEETEIEASTQDGRLVVQRATSAKTRRKSPKRTRARRESP